MRNASVWGFSFQCECVGVGPLATHILAFGKWPRPKRPRAPTTWQLMGVRLVSPTDWLFDWRTDGWSKAFECALLHWEQFQNQIHIFSIHYSKTWVWNFEIVQTGGLSVFFRQSLVTQQCSKHFYKLYYTLYNSLIVILTSDLFLCSNIFYLKHY